MRGFQQLPLDVTVVMRGNGYGSAFYWEIWDIEWWGHCVLRMKRIHVVTGSKGICQWLHRHTHDGAGTLEDTSLTLAKWSCWKPWSRCFRGDSMYDMHIHEIMHRYGHVFSVHVTAAGRGALSPLRPRQHPSDTVTSWPTASCGLCFWPEKA